MTPLEHFQVRQPHIAASLRHLHAHPRLLFNVRETAKFAAEKLRAFGFDEVVGRTGVVGVLHGSQPLVNHSIGLRAEMDAVLYADRGSDRSDALIMPSPA